MKRRRLKEPVTETERRLQEVQGKHKRLLAAFLALRSLRSVSHSSEPALRVARDRLTRLPDVFVDRLRFKNPAPFKQKLRDDCRRVIEDMDAALIVTADEPVAAAYARYLDAANELRPGDLEANEQ